VVGLAATVVVDAKPVEVAAAVCDVVAIAV
jgi:hypothetical protein